MPFAPLSNRVWPWRAKPAECGSFEEFPSFGAGTCASGLGAGDRMGGLAKG